MKKLNLLVTGTLATFMALSSVSAAENIVNVQDEETLKNCLASTSAATTCKFTKEIEADEVINLEKPIIIDFDGNSLSFTGSDTSARLALKVTNGGDVTLKNGKIENKVTGGISTVQVAGNNTNITLEKMDISSGDGGFPIYVNTDSTAKLVIDKDTVVSGKNCSTVTNFGTATFEVYGKVTSEGTASAINGSFQATKTDITVYEGAEVSCTKGGGILQMSEGDVTIKGGTISGATGIAMTKGNLTVEDGTITGNGDYVEFEGTADFQIHDNGAAVYLEPTTVNMNVEIKDGILISEKSYTISAPKNSDQGEANKKLTIAIKDGAFSGALGNIDLVDAEDNNRGKFISGGTFVIDGEPDEDVLDYTENLDISESGKVGKVFKITTEDNENGKIIVNSNAAVGEIVEISFEEKDGYKVSKVFINDEELKATEDGAYIFEMPEKDVNIKAEFISIEASSSIPTESEPEPENPSTLDKAPLYLALGTIALTGITALGYMVKKKFEN